MTGPPKAHGSDSASSPGDERTPILVCGEALYDCFVEEGRGGALTMTAHPGGSPYNVAVGLARLGRRVAFVGGVSGDFWGERLRRNLIEEGVDPRHLVEVARPTTLSVVRKAADGTPDYAFHGGDTADRLVTRDDVRQVGSGFGAVHLGSFSAVVEPVASAARLIVGQAGEDAVVSYDPNLRTTVVPDLAFWRWTLNDLLPRLDLLKISAEDFTELDPGRQPEEVVPGWLASGPKLVVLTRGGEGATAWTRGGRVDRPAKPVSVRDTVGAGDTAQAALLAGLDERLLLTRRAMMSLSRETVVDILDFALSAAAITCTRAGADPPMRADI